MTSDRQLISVIFSFRNEEDVLPLLIRRVTNVLDPLPFDYELVFVNDASSDNSLNILAEHAKENPRIKVITLSRRFGGSECILAGMKYSAGDAVLYMDADLQDPPELIPTLIEKWQEGADVVHTVRTKREGETFLKLKLTDAAYYLIAALADIPLLSEAGDYKLLSRRAVEELLKLPERTPYLRGLASWIGFRQVSVPYVRLARAGGATKFPLFRNFPRDFVTLQGPIGTLAIGLTSFSLFPLLSLLAVGTALVVGSILAFVVMIVITCIEGSLPAVYWLIAAIFFLSGVQLFGMGILGIYIGRVYQDVRGRPGYIIDNIIGPQENKRDWQQKPS